MLLFGGNNALKDEKTFEMILVKFAIKILLCQILQGNRLVW
jgi:hypothetical protein